MSLRDEVVAITRPRSGYKSTLEHLLDVLDEDEAADLYDCLLGEPWLSHAAVAEIVVPRYKDHPALQGGIGDLSQSMISDWRRARGVRLRR